MNDEDVQGLFKSLTITIRLVVQLFHAFDGKSHNGGGYSSMESSAASVTLLPILLFLYIQLDT